MNLKGKFSIQRALELPEKPNCLLLTLHCCYFLEQGMTGGFNSQRVVGLLIAERTVFNQSRASRARPQAVVA